MKTTKLNICLHCISDRIYTNKDNNSFAKIWALHNMVMSLKFKH